MSMNDDATTRQDTRLDADRRDQVFSVQRPWGDFQEFCENEQATVKVITVNPGQRLSLQTHRQRAELWTVLDDAPMHITVGDRTWSAQRGELIWVPLGALHRMANSGDTPARILEVGFGHFDEEDIVRVQDDYARD